MYSSKTPDKVSDASEKKRHNPCFRHLLASRRVGDDFSRLQLQRVKWRMEVGYDIVADSMKMHKNTTDYMG